MEIVTAITRASAALYAQRFIQGLVAAGVNVHLVVSPLGRRLLHDELGMEGIDLAALAGAAEHTVTLYNYGDVGSRLASGSFLHQGMVIVPCSSNTLAAVAHGIGDNLISRAAAAALKERRRLVLRHGRCRCRRSTLIITRFSPTPARSSPRPIRGFISTPVASGTSSILWLGNCWTLWACRMPWKQGGNLENSKSEIRVTIKFEIRMTNRMAEPIRGFVSNFEFGAPPSHTPDPYFRSPP